MKNNKVELQSDPKIQLDEDFVKNLGLIHIKLERLKKEELSTSIYFIVCTLMGLLIMISQRDLFNNFDFTYRRMNELAVSLLIVISGFIIFSVGLNKLKKFRRKRKTVKEEKDEINKILDRNQIEYNCNIVFGRKYHGIQDVVVELSSNNKLLKDSRITYRV